MKKFITHSGNVNLGMIRQTPHNTPFEDNATIASFTGTALHASTIKKRRPAIKNGVEPYMANPKKKQEIQKTGLKKKTLGKPVVKPKK